MSEKKTMDDIYTALKCCAGGCSTTCPYKGLQFCDTALCNDAAELIRTMNLASEGRPTEETWSRTRILEEAQKCVCGQREQDYGGPEDSFRTIANLWTAYMTSVCGEAVEFSAADVAIMLGLLKVARLAANPKHMDSWVDLAGYAACGGEIAGGDRHT